jgi:phytoene synthase
VSASAARPAVADGRPEIAAAYAHCAQIARAHYENFTVGSCLLPRRLRHDLAAVYAFARGADDVADEGTATPAERVARLGAWETHLLACARDPEVATDPVFLALGHTIARHRLPLEPFRDLLSAFRQDAAGGTRTVATYGELLDYCHRSANPVGRIVLGLFGHREAELYARADDVCTGLQLTNFWQDVAGDAARGRVYLPQEDLERFPASRAALETGEVNDPFRRLLAFEVDRARELLRRGLRLADSVGPRLRPEVRIFARGGLAILARIEAVGYDVFTRRPVLGRAELARLVLRGLWR